MNKSVQILLKFGEKSHIQSLLEKGEIFLNTLSYFKQAIPHGRYDITEGRVELKHLNSPFLELKLNEDDDWKKLTILKAHLNKYLNTSRIKSYSLFFISKHETLHKPPFKLTPAIKTMGEYFLLINNPNEFINRMERKLSELRLNYEHGAVQYYDRHSDQNELGYFYKSNEFEYQKEYRFIVESEVPGPLLIEIGPLTEIAEVMDSRKCNGFCFRWK